MATFSELQDEVLTLIVDTPTSVQDLVPTYVKRAVLDLQKRHNFKVMEAVSSTFTTTAGSHELGSVPSDWKELRDTPYLLRNDGTTKDLIWAEDLDAVRDAYAVSDTDETGEPETVVRGLPSNVAGATKFNVWPYSDSNSDYSGGEYRVIVPYWKFLTALSADGDSNWLTTYAEEFIVAKAAQRAFLADWDENRAAVQATIAQGALQELLRFVKRSEVAAVDTLVPHQDVNYPKLRF